MIKVTGLYLGLVGVVFMSLFLKNEMNYDGFHKKAERIFRLTTTDPTAFEDAHFARIFNSEEVPDWAAQIPEIETFVRLSPYRGGLVMHEDQYYEIQQAFTSDSTFFEVFDAELVKGNKSSIFSDTSIVVISESFAQKIFGDANPIGAVISIPEGHFNSEKTKFTIKGVMRDFPNNSHFHPDLLLYPGQDKIAGWAYTYLLLRENTSVQSVATTLSQIMTARKIDAGGTNNTLAHLQNLKDIHLNSHLFREIEANGNMTTLYAFSLAALILLFIALSNYASLNLGMAGFFAKFIALNRILGSSKRVNFSYFFTESVIIVLLAIVIAALTISTINNLILNQYQIDLLQGNDVLVLGIFLMFGLLSILIGLQPLLRQPINRFTLSQSLNSKVNIKSHKKIVIAQYAFAMMLLVAVIVISKQNKFALKHAMGAERGNIISIGPVHSDIQKDFSVFKSELLKQGSITAVSAMMDAPGGETHDMFLFEMEGQLNEEDNLKPIGVFACDYSFANVFDLKFLSGTNFTGKNSDDGIGEYIINESAIPYLGYQDSNDLIGKRFKLLSPVEGVNLPDGKIVGVVKDFHLSGVQIKVEPLILFKRENSWLSNIVVSYTPQMEKDAIADIQNVWTSMFPKYPLSFDYVEALYEKVYKTELIQAHLLTLFTIISLFICSIGLLGISLLVSQSKVKEIGIRKVNGATLSEILIMLNTDFIKWVAIAFVVATPFTYYAMYRWLQGFAYKIDMSWWMFLLAGGVTMFISLVTVSWQSFKAATRNPVDALREE